MEHAVCKRREEVQKCIFLIHNMFSLKNDDEAECL